MKILKITKALLNWLFSTNQQPSLLADIFAAPSQKKKAPTTNTTAHPCIDDTVKTPRGRGRRKKIESSSDKYVHLPVRIYDLSLKWQQTYQKEDRKLPGNLHSHHI